MNSSERHAPVMLNETLTMLDVRPGGRYLDATVGLGGHASAVLQASAPDGRLLGTDADPEGLNVAGERLAHFGERATLRRGWLDRSAAAVSETDMAPLDGVLCDLGVSSLQLDTPERGFAIRSQGPLDMRMGPSDEADAGQRSADRQRVANR